MIINISPRSINKKSVLTVYNYPMFAIAPVFLTRKNSVPFCKNKKYKLVVIYTTPQNSIKTSMQPKKKKGGSLSKISRKKQINSFSFFSLNMSV